MNILTAIVECDKYFKKKKEKQKKIKCIDEKLRVQYFFCPKKTQALTKTVLFIKAEFLNSLYLL